jgi:hypothetical protein
VAVGLTVVESELRDGLFSLLRTVTSTTDIYLAAAREVSDPVKPGAQGAVTFAGLLPGQAAVRQAFAHGPHHADAFLRTVSDDFMLRFAQVIPLSIAFWESFGAEGERLFGPREKG